MSGILKGSHHTSLYTVSMLDLYDYLRCPKIISIKVYKAMRAPEVKRKTQSISLPEPTPQVIGQIGELSTNIAFSPEIEVEEQEGEVFTELRRRGVDVNHEIKRLVKESLKGLHLIRPQLEEQYGEINILGKGETRYGLSPTYGMPDYVAYAEKKDRPILVEVKNSEKKNVRDAFQASFYNTLQTQVGVIIKNERYVGKRFEIKPDASFDNYAETAIVYPRLGEFEPVQETLQIDNEVIKGVWEAKQLGLIGKAPFHNCGEKCPHRKFHIELKEGNLEPAKPLPLIYSKRATEKDADFDALYNHNYYWNKIPTIMAEALNINLGSGKVAEENLVKKLSSILKIDEDSTKEILFSGQTDIPTAEDVIKEMSNDMEPWTKLLGKKKAKLLTENVKGASSRIFSLPKSSGKLISKSWREWET